MTTGRRIRVGALAVSLLAAQVAAAYERPLSPQSIREAYFLGSRKDEKTAEFLSKYVQRLPLPKSGPHVAEIEVRTPYHQVVTRARNAPPGYSSQQAEQGYRAHPNLIFVRVRINLTPTYPAHLTQTVGGVRGTQPRTPEFWRDFSIRLIQEEPIAPKNVSGKPIYWGNGGRLIGSEVELAFDAEHVASGPARVEVLTPDGQRVAAEFDLQKLR